MLTAWVGFLIENLQTHGHIILINVKVNHFAWILGGLSFSCQQGKPEEDYCGIITRLITCDLQSWVMHSLSSSCQQNKCKTGRPVLFLPCSPTLFSSSFLFFSSSRSFSPCSYCTPTPLLVLSTLVAVRCLRFKTHPYSVHRAVSAEQRCSFFILSLCLSSSPSVLSRGLVTFNLGPRSFHFSCFLSTAQGRGEAQLQRVALAQDTAIELRN